MPTWNRDAYLSSLQRAGYQVDLLVNEEVSVSFLRTGLVKYDVIILRTDSFRWEGLDYYCSGEPATSGARKAFSREVSSRELRIGECVGFSALFIQHNYPANSLRRGLVFTIGSVSGGLASVFLAAGSAAFIGYYHEFSLGWGRMDCFSEKLLAYLSEGRSVRDSVVQLDIYIRVGHGNTADWPTVYWIGDGTFKI